MATNSADTIKNNIAQLESSQARLQALLSKPDSSLDQRIQKWNKHWPEEQKKIGDIITNIHQKINTQNETIKTLETAISELLKQEKILQAQILGLTQLLQRINTSLTTINTILSS